MKKKNFYNSITSLLITSFILMPLAAIPQKAEAQSLSGYTAGLLPTIIKLPQCQTVFASSIKNLLGSRYGQLPGSVKGSVDNAIAKGKAAILGTPAVPLPDVVKSLSPDRIATSDTELAAQLKTANNALDERNKAQAAMDAQNSCTNSIGKLVAKMLLQKLTLSTVAWINSGFNGKPAFIQDPGKFFGDIAKNQVLQFGLEINNPTLFPFGKAWLQNQALAFNNKFQDNARYTLNEMITATNPEYSALTFSQDFSMGGWDAWSAMTQHPQNNPLGFKLMADNEIQNRLAGTNQSVANTARDALTAANGFLGDKRCIGIDGKPNGLTQAQSNASLDARGKLGPEPNKMDSKYPEWLANMAKYPVCDTWEEVTPGKLIAEAAIGTVNGPTNTLLNVQDLNAAMAAVMDALLARFSSDLMQKGFANIDTSGSDGKFVIATDSGDPGSSTKGDFTPKELSGAWLQANPDFNIRTDLTQALIDEQRTYSDKLAAQNKELNSTTDGKDYTMNTSTNISNAYGLIPVINQLDYCIPGPHPGWEEDSRRALDAVTNVIIPMTAQDAKDRGSEIVAAAKTLAPMAGAAAGAAIGTFVFPVIGTAIGAMVGALVGTIAGFFGGGDWQLALRAYYASTVLTLTGLRVDSENNESDVANSLLSKQATVEALNMILDRYIDIMRLVYTPKLLPAVTKDATSELNKLQGYGQIITNNKQDMASSKNVVDTLTQIKAIVDKLNTDYPNGGDQYETDLQQQITTFGRISANMVNGDDIASADNLSKQIVDEKNYVYNNLLKGPYGCEKDLQDNKQGLSDQLIKTTRMDYPFPIIYTYNMGANSAIPDPWNSGFVNTTNTKADRTYGPGFLSYYFFQRNGGQRYIASDGTSFQHYINSDPLKICTANPTTGEVPFCQLKIQDILPIGEDRGSIPDKRLPRSLGSMPTSTVQQAGGSDTNSANSGGPWEHTIGVY